MRHRLIGVVIALLLVGCGNHYWNKPGAGFGEFSQDSTACARENAFYSGADRNYGIVRLELYRACLRGRGWARAQQVEPIPEGWFRGIEDDDAVRLDALPPQPVSVQVPTTAAARALPSRPEVAQLIGAWTGTFMQPGPNPPGVAGRYPATLRISDEGGRLSWSMEVQGTDLDASGVVSASENEIKLSGTFTRRGFPVSYTAAVRGSSMELVGLGADNRVYQLAVQKVR